MADRRILIRGAALLDPSGQPLLRPEGAIAVEGRTFRAIGDEPPGFEPDEVLDGRGLVALPGLVNAHCHAAMTLVRGFAEDLPFERWLNERIWVAESALQGEDVYWGAALAACEMVRSGITAFADHYFYMDQVARLVEDSGLKALLAWCHFGLSPEQEVGGRTLEDLEAFARTWHGAAEGRVRVAMGPHSPYMCSPEVLRQMAHRAQDLGLLLHLHLAESEEQLAQSLARQGRGPVRHLEALGLLEKPAILAHGLVLEPDDARRLARPGLTVAHTPKTYMKLGMAPGALGELLGAGVQVALGTDGPASNSDLNLLEVMRLAALREKARCRDAAALPIREILRAATRAPALGFADSGRLVAGAAADLVLIDTRAPHYWPRHDLAAQVVYASHPGDVTHVMVEGRWLLRGGVLQTLDEERIKAEAERRAFRLVSRASGRMREYRG